MTCSHYFILPPPNGATSVGVCKLCGEERVMFNTTEDKYQGWKVVDKSVKRKAVSNQGGF